MNENFIITGIKRVIFVGKHEYSERNIIFKNDLSCNELIFHLSGKGTILFNGKTLECTKNTIRFLPKGKNREYIVNNEENGECIDIFFDADRTVSEEAFVTVLLENSHASLLFKRIFSVWVAKNDGYYFECMSLIYKIFAEMQKENYFPEKKYQKILPAINHINEYFLDKKISIPFLAQKCQISEAYLKKLFIQKFSVSPVKYIVQLKINHACDLLLSGLYSVTQTANLCGYENVHFFSRQFKNYIGISPTEFRKKYISSK